MSASASASSTLPGLQLQFRGVRVVLSTDWAKASQTEQQESTEFALVSARYTTTTAANINILLGSGASFSFGARLCATSVPGQYDYDSVEEVVQRSELRDEDEDRLRAIVDAFGKAAVVHSERLVKIANERLSQGEKEESIFRVPV